MPLTGLPNASTTFVTMGAPSMAPKLPLCDPPEARDIVAAAPGTTLKEFDVAAVAPDEATASVYAPTLAMLVFENVAIPLAAVTVVVPASVPPAGLLASESVAEPL